MLVDCSCGCRFSANLQPNTTATYVCPECNKHYGISVMVYAKLPEGMFKDKLWLEEAYCIEGKTMEEIATECGVTAMTINNWLKRHNIPTRDRGRR